MSEYQPAQMSMMLTSVLEQAVPELLERHHRYEEAQLVEFLSQYYPEVPEALRGPIVVAATLGAKRAALMHVVAEKNAASGDPKKRRMAAEAASSLSFWALGMRSPFRSATSVGHASSMPDVFMQPPQRKLVSRPSVQNAVSSGNVISALSSNQFPVPMRSWDSEFETLYNSSLPLAGSDLLSPISSAAMSSIAVLAAPVPTAGNLEQPSVFVIDDDSGLAESGVPETLNDVQPDSPLQLTAPDDEELAEDCAVITGDHQTIGSALKAVAVPTAAVSSPVSVAPAVMCPAMASLLVPSQHAAAGPPAISPCSGRLMALAKRSTPTSTTGEPRRTHTGGASVSTVASVVTKSGKEAHSRCHEDSAYRRRSTISQTSSKRVREESRPPRVIAMNEEEYRRYQEFVSKLKVKKK